MQVMQLLARLIVPEVLSQAGGQNRIPCPKCGVSRSRYCCTCLLPIGPTSCHPVPLLSPFEISIVQHRCLAISRYFNTRPPCPRICRYTLFMLFSHRAEKPQKSSAVPLAVLSPCVRLIHESSVPVFDASSTVHSAAFNAPIPQLT